MRGYSGRKRGITRKDPIHCIQRVKLTKVCRFYSFFAAIDNLKSSQLLYLSSMGLAATKDNNTPHTSKLIGTNDAVLIESDEDEDRTMVDNDVDT